MKTEPVGGYWIEQQGIHTVLKGEDKTLYVATEAEIAFWNEIQRLRKENGKLLRACVDAYSMARRVEQDLQVVLLASGKGVPYERKPATSGAPRLMDVTVEEARP